MNVVIVVDGAQLPLNDFTQEITGNVARAMAESLRGVSSDWKSISIKVER